MIPWIYVPGDSTAPGRELKSHYPERDLTPLDKVRQEGIKWSSLTPRSSTLRCGKRL
ncbi:hypothetical protein Bpfe_017351, partial [Biomphalaria pfeifferi]